MPEAKAKAKPAPKAKVEKEVAKPADSTKYVDSGLYNPKAAHTVESWQEVVALLPCTLSALEEANKNHKNKGFIAYLKQRKAIVPQGTDVSKLRAPRKKAEPKAADKAA